MKEKILILGIGNLLMGDEGVGVHAVHQIRSENLPPHVDVLDGGTGGFHLMGYLEEYPRIIIIDATMDQQEPGTIRLIEPRFASDFPRALSSHDIGLKDLVESLQLLGRMPKIYLLVVSVAEVQPMKIGLSPKVEKAIPKLIGMIKYQIIV